MASTFLTARWQNLLMINYEVNPQILKKYLPRHTELDEFEGKHFVSLVGFLFKDTKLNGVSVPFHQNFEEVNLRFYVRFKEENTWRRGVVFIKEIVPKRMITFVANKLYGEKYVTHPMRHQWTETQNNLLVSYEWKIGREWNWIKANAAPKAEPIQGGSIEEFITEHYWGYTYINEGCTGVYEVRHPRWQVHPAKDVDVNCATAILYGEEFVDPLGQNPASSFVAQGSAISVLKGNRLYST